jgi:putative transcriptional regulator
MMESFPPGEIQSDSLIGRLLIATPQLQDPRFTRSVVYMCAHTEDGAMGFIVNRAIDEVTFPDLLKQLSIEAEVESPPIRVHFGGPVDQGRGFVLHSSDYLLGASLIVDEDVALTASAEILKNIAEGQGPRRSLLALGYAGWAAGQLEMEMEHGSWLTVSADEGLLFDSDLQTKWARAVDKLGIDFGLFSGEAGHA